MKSRKQCNIRPTRTLLTCALASCLMLGAAPSVFAQSTAATIRGQVMADSAPATDAKVTATNVATGLTRSVQSNASGGYSLIGLPPGTYRIDVAAGGQTSSKTVTVAVGQTATLDLGVGGVAETAGGDATNLDAVTVQGTMLAETRTSEVATYVSQKQIDSLPQNSRNFLAFADTVPGMQFVTSPNGEESQLRSGAQGSSNINVFIDGVGQKNYVTPGGITGQDDSRGNPFPQSAIGEYKVITSNYKAEYDQISSAAVTAVTRSGTNDFSGSFFWDRTADDWRTATPREELEGNKRVSSTEQYGVSFGGPILRDRLHFFVSYEAKDYVVPADVVPPNDFNGQVPPEYQYLLGGTSTPFNQDLYFGKLSFQVDESNLLELTMRYRDESSLSGIGGVNTPSYGNDFVNDETRADLRWQYSNANWLNDAHISFEESSYNPRPLSFGPGINLQVAVPNNPRLDVLRTGGGRNFQDKGQKGIAFQDDLTFFGWENHTLKMGVKYKQVDLSAFEQDPANPQYFFDINESLDVPNRVQFGAAVPGVDRAVESSNKQFGIYVQDDWEVNDKLTLNLGLRWDYEDTPGYTDYEVRPDLAAALRGWTNIQNTDYDIEDYISSGNNRDSFKDAWQPRIGFSYDLNADQRHVIFGGAGRAYDRNLFDYLARERTKGSFPTYEYNFNTPAYPCAVGVGRCLDWDPSYYDPAALAALVAANPNLGGEVNLVNNDLKTPYSDQFSLGMRNAVDVLGHSWNTSVALSHIRSHDGIIFRLGNRYEDGRFRANPDATWGGAPFGQGIPGFGTLILADNGIETRLSSLLVSVDKPYTPASGWGITIAYTYSDAEENRLNASNGETYIFDYPNVGNTFYTSTGVAKHRLVAAGIFDIPWGFTLSSKLTLATPTPRDTVNCFDAPDFDNCFFDPYTPDTTIGYKQFDVALQKIWDTGSDISFSVRADVLNLFDWRNWNDYEGWRGGPGDANQNFEQRNGIGIIEPTRTFKLSFGLNW